MDELPHTVQGQARKEQLFRAATSIGANIMLSSTCSSLRQKIATDPANPKYLKELEADYDPNP